MKLTCNSCSLTGSHLRLCPEHSHMLGLGAATGHLAGGRGSGHHGGLHLGLHLGLLLGLHLGRHLGLHLGRHLGLVTGAGPILDHYSGAGAGAGQRPQELPLEFLYLVFSWKKFFYRDN